MELLTAGSSLSLLISCSLMAHMEVSLQLMPIRPVSPGAMVPSLARS